LSTPASMKGGPFASLVLVKKRYLLFYVFLIWMSMNVIQLEIWLYIRLFFYSNLFLFLIGLPLFLFFVYITFVFVSLIFAKILLMIINLIHPPREGTFYRDPSDKDYRYWSIRNTIKKWPIWLSHKFPFPFLDNICLKMFGVKTLRMEFNMR